MLKFFFWILLMANAALFAYQQGALDSLLPSGREPARIANQLNADKVRVIPASEAKRESVPPSSPPPPVAEPVAAVAAVEGKVEKVLACTEVGNFTPEEAKHFSTQVATFAPGERISQRAVQEVATHMVYIPPQPDKAGADKKAEQLRQLGISDFFIIQDNSPLRWGISLGVFKQEEAARTHLASLNKKGVRTARITQRTVSSSMTAFQLRDIDAKTKASLEKIMADFPKQAVRECEPA
ncbi:MAG TPA: SPOR domain-containing protein [Noviherbaspirillum sp.]|nr:SPOR domain-containing protein [Noviherbaspirillum sp.]